MKDVIFTLNILVYKAVKTDTIVIKLHPVAIIKTVNSIVYAL